MAQKAFMGLLGLFSCHISCHNGAILSLYAFTGIFLTETMALLSWFPFPRGTTRRAPVETTERVAVLAFPECTFDEVFDFDASGLLLVGVCYQQDHIIRDMVNLW